jgi:hypothetical protein
MRYAMVMLLLVSPAFCGEPVYSWRTRGDDPERAYLYQDGKQIGGWDYRAKQYRPLDGQNWGAPTDTAPVRPPDQRVFAIPQQMLQQLPKFIPQPSATPIQVRPPLQAGLGNFMADIYMAMFMKTLEQIPGAIADSIAKGNYQLNYQSSVNPAPQQPESQTNPTNSGQPARSPQRRWLFPRP